MYYVRVIVVFSRLYHARLIQILYSYNRVNNSYACGNSKILNGLLKSELGFQGFVLTDWGAQSTTLVYQIC